MRFLLFLLISVPCFGARPPSQDVIDKYVNLAINIDDGRVGKLEGPWSCSDAIAHNHKARGRTQEEAMTVHQLLCIKHECETLGQKVIDSAQKLKAMPEEELKDFFEFKGYSPDESEIKISQIKNSSPEQEEILNCKTGSAGFRMVAFDSCFSVPVECTFD